METINIQQWIKIFQYVAEDIAKNEKLLNNLDNMIGDGDHGSSMKRGFEAVIEKISDKTDFKSVGELFANIGTTLVGSVGGAIGPILGSFFLGAAKISQDKSEISLNTWSSMFIKGLESIQNIGKAQFGDKTLLDALQPASIAFQEAQDLNLPLVFAFEYATKAAELGAKSTSEMIAKYGRAKNLGERSLGYQDPGANSFYLMINAMREKLISLQTSNAIDVSEDEKTLTFINKDFNISVTKEDSILEISLRNGEHTLQFAGPIKLSSDTNHSFYLSDLSSWYAGDETIVLPYSGDSEGNYRFFTVIDFPQNKTCRIRVRTSDISYSQTEVDIVSSTDEAFFGGGERFASVNQSGKYLINWTDDKGPDQTPGHVWTYWPIPFLISNKGYGLLLNNFDKSVLDLCASDPQRIKITAHTTKIQLETYWEEDPKDIIGCYLNSTGKPIIPPSWNNGVWVTCLGGQDKVLEKAKYLRSENIPCSALWVYDAHDPQGNIGWPICPMHHSGEYQNISVLVNQLHDLGFKVQTYLFPYYYIDSPLYNEAESNNYFLRNYDGSTYKFPFFRAVGRNTTQVLASIVDFTNPDAKKWWQKQLEYVMIDLGFDGWMHDFGESVPDNVKAYNGMSGAEIHNQYPVLYQQAAREVCQRVKPDASFYARSGYIGSQKWLSAAWTGDQICSWEEDKGIKSVIPACLSLSICGVFHIGPDIGGYFGRNLPEESLSFSKELFIRWTELAAFTTIMRDHLADKPDESINLWSDRETQNIFKRYAWFHMSLSPYIQAYGKRAANTGHPIMQHMFLIEPENPKFWNCDDQYMFGDSILVAPVLSEGVRERSVILPSGKWIDYWSGQSFQGSQMIDVSAPLDQIPLLIKEGTFLPTLKEHSDTLVESNNANVTVATEDLRIQVFIPGDWSNRTGKLRTSHLEMFDGTKLFLGWQDRNVKFSTDSSNNKNYMIEIPSKEKPGSCYVNGKLVDIGNEKNEVGTSCWFDKEMEKIYLIASGRSLEIEFAN